MVSSVDMEFTDALSLAQELDREDPLQGCREQFIIPEHGGRKQIYFLGNSLGLQPKATALAIQEVLEQWSQHGVEAFFQGSKPWLDFHDQLTGPLSAIAGALPSEISVMNQLTVNLHLMMVSFYRPEGKRKKILCEAKAFPSDQYMLETHVRNRGMDPEGAIIEISPRTGENSIREDDIVSAIEQHNDELALVLLGGVNYYTGQVFNMRLITAAAHQYGIKVGFDLAHAIGNVPLALHDWNVDFACWCSYKYLNSGPGAVGGAFIHERYHRSDLPRYAGWWGFDKSRRFLMEKGFRAIPSAEGWQLSTPSPILYACHLSALKIFEEAGMERLHAKRRLMSTYLWHWLDEVSRGTGAATRCLTPRAHGESGCQVSLLVPHKGRAVFDALSAQGVMADWREPDVIRIAPVPLYNSFEEVWRFGNILRDIMIKKSMA